MYWTLELASYLSDAPWPATKDELIDYAIRTGAPLEVVENLQELIEDEQFWNIIKIDEKKLFFQSLNRIYIYDEPAQTFKIIDSETTITKMYKANNSVYFQEMNLGLFQIVGDKKVLVSGDEILKNDVITNIFSFGGELLILNQNNGFYVLKNGSTI